MRVMVASGDRLIAIAGSARCCSASQNAPMSPASRLSSVSMPVTTGGGLPVSGKRPPSAAQPSHMANTSCSSSPRKKRGIEIDASESSRTR